MFTQLNFHGCETAQPGDRPLLEALADTVSKAFAVSAEQLKSGSRRRTIVQARPPRLREFSLVMAGERDQCRVGKPNTPWPRPDLLDLSAKTFVSEI